MESFDVIVVGGGPAGLAAAIAAAQHDLSVLVADVHEPPVDKLCGEGLLPDAIDALCRLGVVLNPRAGLPFSGISFHNECHQFAASFHAKPALGLRRTVLHDALVEAATRAGVTMRWKTRAEVMSPRIVRVGQEEVFCRYIIGADGHRSLVRNRAGLSTKASLSNGWRRRQRLASGCHYRCAPWSRFVEVHWTGNVQAYVTPVSHAQVSVAVLCRDRQVRADEALKLFPALQTRLAGAERMGREQGAASLMLQLPRVVAGDVALIGEASGSVDAITGEGLSLVFRQALALGEAFRLGDLEHYQRQHCRIQWRSRWMARLLLSLSEYPRWRGRVFHALAAETGTFENLLNMHVGHRPRLLGAGGCTELFAHLLFS